MIRWAAQGRTKASLILNLFGVFALGALVYIALHTDFSLIWREVRALPALLVGLLFCLQIATQLALNYQWFRLCRILGLKASFGALLVVNAYGTVVDAANPGEKVGGELARVLQLHNLLGFSAQQATSLVTIQKALSLAALVILNGLAVFVLGDALTHWTSPFPRIAVLVVLLGLAVLLGCALFGTERLNSRIQSIRGEGRLVGGLKRWMARFARDTAAIGRRPGEWGRQFLLALVIWTLFPLKLQLIVSQYARVNPLLLFAITFLAYFAAMVPLLPGGLGTFEAVMGGMLMAAGLGWERALAISLVFRFITFWFVVLLSVLIITAAKVRGLVRKC